MDESKEIEGLQSLNRAISVLECLAVTPLGMGLSQLARETGMSKSTVLRILRTWQDNNYVVQKADSCYYVDWKFFVLAGTRSQAQDLRNTAHPYLQELSDASHETSHLALLVDDEVVYVDQIQGRQEVGVATKIGRRVPIYAVASGKAILAYLDEVSVARILENVTPFTPRTIVDRRAMIADIEGTRRRGYSIAKGEFTKDVGSVGAPILDSRGVPKAAVSIVFPLVGITNERIKVLGESVSKAASSVSAELGWFKKDMEEKWSATLKKTTK